MHKSVWNSYWPKANPEEMVNIFLDHGFQCTELSDEHCRVLFGRGIPGNAGKEF